MKKLLTIACFAASDVIKSFNGGVELFYTDINENRDDFFVRAVKQAKGKYIVFIDREILSADLLPLLQIVETSRADIIAFRDGAAIKVNVLKGVDPKLIYDSFCCNLYAAFNSKSIFVSDCRPFKFAYYENAYDDKTAVCILNGITTFKKVKAKLPRAVYTYSFEILCSQLISFYVSNIIAIKEGKISADKLIDFDKKLKSEIVLYLALEKRFTAAKLNKLRAKNFKISGWTAKKFRKFLSN